MKMKDINANDMREYDFVEHMPGGAFVCRAEGDKEILFANQSLIKILECESYEELMEYVGGCYAGMVGKAQFQSIQKELDLQVKENKQSDGRLFYHVLTKNGNLCLAEEHWSLVHDPELGDVYYSFLISREYETMGADYDSITGLY